MLHFCHMCDINEIGLNVEFLQIVDDFDLHFEAGSKNPT